MKPFSEPAERNREPILAVLKRIFADRRSVLEIGSGTGQHAAYFSAALPQLAWQASDVAANLPDIRQWISAAPPLELDVDRPFPAVAADAVFSANTCHIMSWAQVEKLFSTWQTKKPYARLVDKAFNVPAAEKSVDVKDKENVNVVFGFDVAMKDTDGDYPAWLMLSQVLGGDTGARLWFRLREHEGLSYGVNTWAFANALDEAGGFGGYAIMAPQNLGKGKTSLLDEINKMASGKVTDKELQHAKDAWIKDQDTSLSDDNYVVQMLSRELFRSRTTDFTKQLRAKIQAVTPADIERVAHKWFDPKRLVFVDAGDHAKEK